MGQRFTHDPAGNLLTATEVYSGASGERTSRRRHDAFGRVVEAVDGFGETTRYTYL